MRASTETGFFRAPRLRTEVLVVALLTVVGLLVRVWRLESLPPGLWWDEANNALLALKVLHGGGLKLFFQYSLFPVEPLYEYWLMPFLVVFGRHAWTLHLASVVVGTLTLPVFYLFTREWFDRRTALIALVCLVFLRWHILFSRLGFRTILTPLFLLFGFYSLHRALTNRRMGWFITSGIVFGAGLYTYITYRLLPLFFPWFLYYHIQKREISGTGEKARGWREFWTLKKQWAVWLICGTLVVLPLLVHFAEKPYHFSGRSSMVSIFNGKKSRAESFKQLAVNAEKVALMFSFRGDPNSRNNIPERKVEVDGKETTKPPMPLFDPLTSIFFMIGVAVTLWRARRSHADFLVLFWILGFVPASLLSTGAPSFLRLLAIAPMAAFLLARGGLAAYDGIVAWRPALCTVATILVCLVLAWYASLQCYGYFVTYPQPRYLYYVFSQGEAEMGQFAERMAEKADVYIPGDYLRKPSVKFYVYGSDRIHPLTLPDALAASEPGAKTERARVIISTVFTKLYPYLEALYPEGRFVRDFRQPKGAVWAKKTGGVWARAYQIPADTPLKSRDEVTSRTRGKKIFPYL